MFQHVDRNMEGRTQQLPHLEFRCNGFRDRKVDRSILQCWWDYPPATQTTTHRSNPSWIKMCLNYFKIVYFGLLTKFCPYQIWNLEKPSKTGRAIQVCGWKQSILNYLPVYFTIHKNSDNTGFQSLLLSILYHFVSLCITLYHFVSLCNYFKLSPIW